MKPRAALVAVLGVALLPFGCGDRPERPGSARPRGPGAVLTRFVEAAHARDTAGMWALLSSRTQRRYGPTLRSFGLGEARRFERVPGTLTRPVVSVAERLTSAWAVAAVGGNGSPYAAPLRLEREGWKLELGDPVRVRVLRPNPGEKVAGTTQLAAEARASGAIDQAGLWLDGVAVPARAGGPNPRALSVYTRPEPFERGVHVVVFFAGAGRNAAALAWRFRVKG